MPTSFLDNPDLSRVRSEAASAASAYSEAAKTGLTLPDMLREALSKKFSTESPLLKQREGAVKTYMTESANAPLAVTPVSAGGTAPVVYNPLEQASLIAGRRASALAPLTSLNALLALSQSGMENVIGETGRVYQGVVEGLKNEATIKRQSYTDLLDELSKTADEAYKYAALAKSGGTSSAKTTKEAAQSTMNYISDIKSYETREEALRDFELMKELMATQGVDVEAVRNAIDTYFPPPAQEQPAQGNTGGNWFQNLLQRFRNPGAANVNKTLMNW